MGAAGHCTASKVCASHAASQGSADKEQMLPRPASNPREQGKTTARCMHSATAYPVKTAAAKMTQSAALGLLGDPLGQEKCPSGEERALQESHSCSSSARHAVSGRLRSKWVKTNHSRCVIVVNFRVLPHGLTCTRATWPPHHHISHAHHDHGRHGSRLSQLFASSHQQGALQGFSGRCAFRHKRCKPRRSAILDQERELSPPDQTEGPCGLRKWIKDCCRPRRVVFHRIHTRCCAQAFADS